MAAWLLLIAAARAASTGQVAACVDAGHAAVQILASGDRDRAWSVAATAGERCREDPDAREWWSARDPYVTADATLPEIEAAALRAAAMLGAGDVDVAFLRAFLGTRLAAEGEVGRAVSECRAAAGPLLATSDPESRDLGGQALATAVGLRLEVDPPDALLAEVAAAVPLAGEDTGGLVLRTVGVGLAVEVGARELAFRWISELRAAIEAGRFPLDADLNLLALEAVLEPERAVALGERRLALAVDLYGDTHPAVGDAWLLLGQARETPGDPARQAGAREAFLRARALRARAFGEDDPSTREAALLAARAGLRLGLFAEAEAEARAAIEGLGWTPTTTDLHARGAHVVAEAQVARGAAREALEGLGAALKGASGLGDHPALFGLSAAWLRILAESAPIPETADMAAALADAGRQRVPARSEWWTVGLADLGFALLRLGDPRGLSLLDEIRPPGVAAGPRPPTETGVEALRRGIEETLAQPDPSLPAVPLLWLLVSAEQEEARPVAAVAAADRAIAEAVRRHGPTHPLVGQSWMVRATLAAHQRDPAAVGYAREALRLDAASIADTSGTRVEPLMLGRVEATRAMTNAWLEVLHPHLAADNEAGELAYEAVVRAKWAALDWQRAVALGASPRLDVPTVGTVAGSLGPGTVLVEWAIWVPQRAPPRYAVFVVGRDGLRTHADLGDAAAIDKAVEAWRQAVVDKGDGAEEGAAVSALALGPAWDAVGDATAVVVAPVGGLALAPLAALPDPTGRPWIDAVSMRYATSGGASSAAAPVSGTGVIAVGGVDYEAGEGPPAEVQWSALAGAEAEAQGVAAAWGGRLVAGGEATEAELRRLAGPRLLHLASHALFSADGTDGPVGAPPPRAELRSARLVIAGPPRPIDIDARTGSRLVLAGANQGGQAEDDGYLTALEASRLDLSGTELVVLSACETAVGNPAAWEAVDGLRRGFMIAGARSVVASLWQVHDAATEALMDAFHRHLVGGEPREQALRAAALEVRSRPGWEAPYYWAGFTLLGESGPLR